MADNYLEKRMDDYRAGRLGGPRSGKSLAASQRATPENVMVLKFPPMRCLVISRELSPLAIMTARAARAVGAKVALMSDDRKNGATEAQRSGLRFYPAFTLEKVLDDLNDKWGGVDVILSENEVESPVGTKLLRLTDMGGTTEDMARFYIFLSHPANSFFTVS